MILYFYKNFLIKMGAFDCNVNMDNAPTKKSFHKKWEKYIYNK